MKKRLILRAIGKSLLYQTYAFNMCDATYYLIQISTPSYLPDILEPRENCEII